MKMGDETALLKASIPIVEKLDHRNSQETDSGVALLCRDPGVPHCHGGGARAPRAATIQLHTSTL